MQLPDFRGPRDTEINEWMIRHSEIEIKDVLVFDDEYVLGFDQVKFDVYNCWTLDSVLGMLNLNLMPEAKPLMYGI